MASKGSALDFFSALGRSVSKSSLSPNFSSPSVGRTPSFTGPSGIIENLSSLHAELDGLLGETEENTNGVNFRVNSFDNKQARYLLKIRRSHWKDASKSHNCKRCGKSFSFASKKYNCRRCGNVFCDSCCQYRRRLSPECISDPQGNVYRVCYACADLNSQPIGSIQNLTNLFHEQRKNKRMTISNELPRLIEGFETFVNPTSKLKTVMSDTLSVMKVPEWQKSVKWLESSEVEWCTKCSVKFSLFNSKHHCRLCGSVYCRMCCKPNLLLYFNEKKKGTAVLIGVVGCPDKEPALCLYLPVCALCQEDLEEYQVQQYHLVEAETDDPKASLKEVGNILDRLRILEKKLEIALPRFQELVEAYVFEGQANDTGQSNVEFFAKLQGDISDLFTQYAVVIQGLKKFEMHTKTELKIMKNIITLKCRQYNQGMNLFKSLKDSLDKSLPAKALQQFQNYANMQAINNTFVMTRQLGFEALNLATKHGFEASLAEKLSEVDQVCFNELKDYVQNSNEDWDEHLTVLNKFLKQQLKQNKLVSPSSTMSSRDGRRYVYHYLIERSCSLLYQVLRALKAKSSDKLFSQSKDALQTLLNIVSECNIKQGKYRPTNQVKPS